MTALRSACLSPNTLIAHANLVGFTGQAGMLLGPRPIRSAAHPEADPGPEHSDTLGTRANLAY
jgi:hypothetical protein